MPFPQGFQLVSLGYQLAPVTDALGAGGGEIARAGELLCLQGHDLRALCVHIRRQSRVLDRPRAARDWLCLALRRLESEVVCAVAIESCPLWTRYRPHSSGTGKGDWVGLRDVARSH